MSTLNIGHRHILPMYPAMFVLAGGAASWLLSGNRLRKAAVGVLLVAFVAESVEAYPHYLPYFNYDRAHAYRRLVDINLDWGRDFPGLKHWLDTNNPPGAGHRRVYLFYFGTGRPEYYGIDAVPDPFAHQLHGGLYYISATEVNRVCHWPGGG